jgi:tetratricopeptide (TPR) repeat protein
MPGEESYGSHYQVLGIGRKASREAVDHAYFQLARKLHPDVAGDSPETVAKFARINEAYLVLSDSEERRKYDEEIADTIPWEPEPVVTRVPEPGRAPAQQQAQDVPPGAEAEPQQPAKPAKPEKPVRPGAKEGPAAAPGGAMPPATLARLKAAAGRMIREGDYWRSGDLLNRAAMTFPRDPEVRRLQAMAAEGRGRLREAAEFLKNACEAEYFNPENHVMLGRVYMKAEQYALARKSLENALSWQEDHEGAMKSLEELGRLESRKAPVWKKIFGGRRK